MHEPPSCRLLSQQVLPNLDMAHKKIFLGAVHLLQNREDLPDLYQYYVEGGKCLPNLLQKYMGEGGRVGRSFKVDCNITVLK